MLTVPCLITAHSRELDQGLPWQEFGDTEASAQREQATRQPLWTHRGAPPHPEDESSATDLQPSSSTQMPYRQPCQPLATQGTFVGLL